MVYGCGKETIEDALGARKLDDNETNGSHRGDREIGTVKFRSLGSVARPSYVSQVATFPSGSTTTTVPV